MGGGSGDGFADLVGDGVGVGPAVPDFALFGGEGVGVYAGEGVFGFGAGGDVYAGDGVREVGEGLGGGEGEEELVVGGVGGGGDAGDVEGGDGRGGSCGDGESVAGLKVEGLGEGLTEDGLVRLGGPGAGDAPGGVELGCSGEGRGAAEGVVEPEAEGGDGAHGKCEGDGELGADAGDVVGPEDGFELVEVGLAEVGVAGGGLDVYAADFDVEVGGPGGDDDVGAVDGEFFVDAVADGGGEGEHGGDGGGSEQDGDAGEELAAALAAEGFEQESEEHGEVPPVRLHGGGASEGEWLSSATTSSVVSFDPMAWKRGMGAGFIHSHVSEARHGAPRFLHSHVSEARHGAPRFYLSHGLEARHGVPGIWWLAVEDRDEGAEVGGGDGDLASGVGGLEGDGVAAAGLTHGGGVEGGGAHLADDSLGADVEAYRAADLAGVGYGGDVAVGFFVEEEANFGGVSFSVVELDAVAVELVVVDLGGGDGDLGSDEGDGRGGGE